MTIVITRPLEDAVDDAQALRAAGFETMIEPMLSIAPITFTLPDLSGYQAILFTSGNAVRLFAAETKLRDIPLYVVGRDTALEAERRGFKYVFDAQGTGDDLVVLVQKSVQDKTKPVLHVRGTHVAVPVDEMLADGGIQVDSLIVYEARKTTHFSGAFIEALKTNKIEAVSFYSKRTAENFVALISAGGHGEKLKSIKALCISKAVLECIQSYPWSQTYTAKAKNGVAMMALMEETCTKIQPIKFSGRAKKMANTSDKEASNTNTGIENAEEIIERFGGIRPMAKKIDVAVTTVQGWKKRDTIPAGRRAQVLEAASEYNVDLSDILDGAAPAKAVADAPAANENGQEKDKAQDKKPEAAEKAAQPDGADDKAEVQPLAAPAVGAVGASPRTQDRTPAADSAKKPEKDLAAKLSATEKNAVAKSTWINVILILITIAAVAALLWPDTRGDDARLASLEQNINGLRGDVDAVKDEQSFLSTLIPEDLDERIATLQGKAQEVKETAGAAMDKAKVISDDVLAEDAGTMEERVVKLQNHMGEIAADPRFDSLKAKFESMNNSLLGQQKLDAAVSELSALTGAIGAGSTEQFNQALDAARQQSTNLNQTFDNVPTQDLKAATLLLGMTQFRESLNRNNEPFADDLELLINLTAEDNPELAAALMRLAPRAEEGVLTPGGLSSEFKTIAGDVVVSSLKGEDVSFGEKAKARMNELFQVEKDGELITGTPTQATVTKANTLLEEGDIAGAIAEMQSLEGEQAEIAQPWIDKAQATLIAQQAKEFMEGAAASFEGFGGPKLIQNEETGINILKRN